MLVKKREKEAAKFIGRPRVRRAGFGRRNARSDRDDVTEHIRLYEI